MSEALGAPQEGSVPGDPSADIVLERPVPADQSAEIVPDGQSGATETEVLAESTEEQDVWVEQGRPRALTAPEAEDECDESPLAALRKSKTVDVDQEEGQKAGKMKKKVVKKKKKIVSIDAKAEVEVEVLEAIVAEMPEVDGVVPEVIGRSLTSVTVQSEPRSVIVEEMPPRMPPDLPFHFRLDVGALRIGTGKTFPSDWWNKLSSSLEKEWRYCRKDQERAWVNHKELPCEIRDAAKRNGKSLEDVCGGIRQRKEESWQKICPQRGTVRTYPMKVLKFETAPGRKLKQEDLEGAKEDIWCHMTYDLKDDPLLKDMGHEGPTIFSALMLFYISYSEWDSKSAMEIRVSHIDHFEFALCFPTAPYPLCQLEAPEFDFGRYFEVDLAGGEQALESMMSQVRPLLTWLFWDCFDELFSEEVKRTNTSRAAHATGLAYKVRSLVTSQTKLKELKQCQERPEALASLLSLVRAQAFKFPFRGRVSKEDARNYRLDICNKEESNGPNEPWEPLKSNDELDLLAAVELAAQNAIKDYVHALEEEGGLLPRQWTMEAPLKLRSAGKKLVEKVAPVQLIEKDGTEKLQMKELALIECVGAIQLDRRPRPKETEYRQVTAEVSEANEVLEDAQGMPSVADAEEAEEEEKGLEYEQKAMVLTADLSGWPGEDGELVVGDFNLNDQHSIRDALTAVEHMENLMWDEDTMRPCLKEKLSRLAFGLRALQRASMKLQLRSVGLAVLETQREVAATSASDVFLERVYQRLSGRPKKTEPPATGPLQRVLLLSAPEKVLRRRAEVRKLRRRVLPNKADDEFLGGFVRKQFDQEGPLQRYWVETYQMPYAYRPFFQPPSPHIDPAALLSSAERKYLVKSFITDPLSETLGPGGTVDPRHGGANMDPRQLLTDGIINEGLLHLHSQMSAIHLTNGFVYPWRFRGWRHYYLVSWCRCDTELVRHHFGPKIGSYFEFVETYITFLFIASVLGIVAEISGPPNGPGKHGFWKFVQPIFGVCMSMWGTFFCIFWRRRCAWLSHIWGNGWIEDGEEMRGAGSLQSGSSQVRPEFALQWRQSFEQAKPARQEETLKMLKTLLRAPNTQHFDDRALTCDIMRFDEACYLSDFVQLYRFVLSYLASGCFILLASGATYGALAANQLLGLNGKTAGYAVTGLTTSVLVPVLNVIHYQVVIKTNNYQLFREDSEREKDFFDRLFVFNLFNTYNSLIWIAFVERNMEQVRVQVFFLLLSSIFINNMLEFYWSHAVKQLKKMGHGNTNSIRQMLRYILVGEIEDIVINPMDPIKTALEHVTDEMTRDAAFELVDEAIELVIQYGLIMMFTVAFPLAPVLALVNVHIEKRLDAYKLVKLMQSPEPRMVVGMGRAFNAFVVVTGLGLVVSGLLLYFAQYPGDTCETCTMFGNCGACAGTSVELILPEFSTEERLFLLGAGEHAMLILMYACFTSASVGKDIIHEQYRQRFYENRLESMESGKDSHHRRRSTYYG